MKHFATDWLVGTWLGEFGGGRWRDWEGDRKRGREGGRGAMRGAMRGKKEG